ncbi:site-specific integrase [Mycobacterium intracellulare]|nr:site-specific integrase [Mycobacterium intracellulare]MCA2367027.1 site-specific integrase [Mycobacterium intracellulare]
MPQRRGQRQGVENLWVSRSGQRTKLYGKGKQYRARYVDSSGKEHTRRFQYKLEAAEWLKHVTRRGLDIAPPVVGEWTVADQFAQWIRKADIAETTRATRRHTWNAHLQERWGHVQVTAVDPPGVKSWVADLVDKGTGVPTIENALGVLRMLMADALSDHRLLRNPCDGVRAPKRKHKRREYLDHPQVEQLAAAIGRDGLIVRFKAYTGLRWGELAALTVGAVDLKRRRLQINGSFAEAGGQVVWKAPKDHERRSVPFPPFLLSDLKAALAGKGRDDLVFQAPQGGVLRISHWRPRVFNPARDSLGVDFPRITPHDLRHTAASLVVSGGGNVLALARMLGHQSPKETLETYADLFDTDLDALADVLDRERAAALKQSQMTNSAARSTVNSNESARENVPSTLATTN